VDRWFAVARSEEVIPRHIVHTQLSGREIAVWRDAAGGAHAWENRCPHRGVRLSLGINTGAALHCRYHGWRFAGDDGRCIFIPSHPNQKPAGTIRAGVFASSERHGYVWVHGGAAPGEALPDVAPPAIPRPAGLAAAIPSHTLRSVFVEAPAPALTRALQGGYGLEGGGISPVVMHDRYTAMTAAAAQAVTFLLQPVSDSQTVLHGVLHADLAVDRRLEWLRDHHARMTRLRDAAERSG
jgi:nitrite reductase/ring-hydroxylating ferredoxin subunit